MQIPTVSPASKKWFLKLLVRGPGGCRLWPSYRARDNRGYGVLRIDGVWVRARTLAWALGGRTPPSAPLVLSSTCGNPSCCAIAHLICVTRSEVGRRRAERQRILATTNTKASPK